MIRWPSKAYERRVCQCACALFSSLSPTSISFFAATFHKMRPITFCIWAGCLAAAAHGQTTSCKLTQTIQASCTNSVPATNSCDEKISINGNSGQFEGPGCRGTIPFEVNNEGYIQGLASGRTTRFTGQGVQVLIAATSASDYCTSTYDVTEGTCFHAFSPVRYIMGLDTIVHVRNSMNATDISDAPCPSFPLRRILKCRASLQASS